jgi:16S rRNA (adenine1518-N6/adenine1519-N6)-dimethyltransferase
MQTKSQIQELLTAAGVSPNRKLGQHFLVDLNLLRLLLDAAQIRRSDGVLEIGTGTGSLTEALAEQAGHVVTVELDPTLAGIAQSRLAGVENVQILNTDVLSGKGTIDPAVTEAVIQAQARLKERGIGLGSPTQNSALGVPFQPMSHRHELAPAQAGDADATNPHGQDARATSHRPAKGPMGQPGAGIRLLLVSNLPYDVASSVMINLVKGPVTADAMFVTVQKEVAERMTARPGGRDYGTLSIFLQATGAVEILRRLKPSVFWPPPGVDSAMVRYARDEARSRRIRDMDLFGRVIGLFIGHRRKMLRACIKQAPSELGGRDLWLEILQRHDIDPTRRPEEMSPDQYVDLANTCHRLLQTRTP